MEELRQLDFLDERSKKDVLGIDENRTPMAFLLDGLEDMINVGSIFRLADALRLEKIYFYQNSLDLTHKKLSKVARSTDKYTRFQGVDFQEVTLLIEQYEMVVIDKTSESIDYKKYQKKTSKPLLFVLGNEQHGVCDAILKLAPHSIHLPMLGVNTSMNVAMAGAIVAYHFYSENV